MLDSCQKLQKLIEMESKKCYIICSRTNHKRGTMSLHEFSVYPNYVNLSIYGASGSVYYIKIQEGELITCSCKDRLISVLHPSICEHVAFVLEKVFKVNDIPVETYTISKADFQCALNPYDN